MGLQYLSHLQICRSGGEGSETAQEVSYKFSLAVGGCPMHYKKSPTYPRPDTTTVMVDWA